MKRMVDEEVRVFEGWEMYRMQFVVVREYDVFVMFLLVWVEEEVEVKIVVEEFSGLEYLGLLISE